MNNQEDGTAKKYGIRYRVFARNWYRRDENGLLVPCGGARKTTLAYVNHEEEALAVCRRYNESHKPGPLSRKAEWESV